MWALPSQTRKSGFPGFGGLGQDTHFAFADLIQLGIGFDHVLQTMIKGLFPGVSPVNDLLQIV